MQHSGIIPDFQGSGFYIVLKKALVWKRSKYFFLQYWVGATMVDWFAAL